MYCGFCHVDTNSDQYFNAVANKCYCSATRAPCPVCDGTQCPICDNSGCWTRRLTINLKQKDNYEDAYDRAMKGL